MLLPQAERRDEIRFYFAKRMPYKTRMAASFGIMLVGFAIQFAAPDKYIAGLPFILAGVLLLLSKGFDNKVDPGLRHSDWQPTSKEQLKHILELNKKSRQWDIDAVDITNWLGFIALFSLGAIVLFLSLVFGTVFDGMGKIFIADAAVMFLPFWVTGVKFILKNDNVIIKTKLLLKVNSLFETIKDEGERFQIQMQTSKTKDESGEVPYDLKAVVLFENGPEDFLGIQMQIAVNDVQGTGYPYFYCVLVARKGFAGLKMQDFETPPKKVIVETDSQEDVEIAVIRQYTTKTSGYHTKDEAIKKIFWFALKEARRLC